MIRQLALSFRPLYNQGGMYAVVRGMATTNDDALRTAFSYCVDQVKRYDYENYVWAVQLPKVGGYLCVSGGDSWHACMHANPRTCWSCEIP
jgi:hypothetical protein